VFLQRVTVRGYRAASSSELVCELPGRFSIVLGANGTGKTTLAEALYLGHRHVFPQIARPIAAALSPTTDRSIEIEYAYEDPERHPFWSMQQLNGTTAPVFQRRLEPSMGRVRATRIEGADDTAVDALVLLFLRADRRPIDELAGREARLIVEAMRAEQERRSGHRRLSAIKGTVGRLLDHLHHDPLVQSLEERVQREIGHLAGGVRPHFPFLGRTVVDDDLLARILEFVLATVDNHALAQRLEISALGYVNLLHLAVILAAIPGHDPVVDEIGDRHDENADSTSNDQGSAPPPLRDEVSPNDVETPKDTELAEAERAIEDANDESETILDSLFPPNPHVIIVIEEPEAHLHPQLQHGLTRHLRRVVERRPELQVIMTTHSSDVISGGSVRDLVVLKRRGDKTISRSPNGLPLTESVRDRVLTMADRHLDVTRSAALFAPYLIVVEGITDAMLVRRFGHVWAADDDQRVHFVDALTITMAGSRIGDWIPRLLATPGNEIVERLAILGDEDKIGDPPWLPDFDADRVRCCLSKPTLEPSLVDSNAALVEAALERIGADLDTITRTTVRDYFGKLGAGASKKAEFAEAIVDLIDEGATAISVPHAIAEALDFLWRGLSQMDSPDGADEPEVDGDPKAAN